MTIPLSHILISTFFLVLTIILRWGFARKLVLLCYKYIPRFKSQQYDEVAVRSFVGETSKKLGIVMLMIAVIIILKPENAKDVLIAGWFTFAYILVGSMTFFGRFDLVKWYKTR